MEWDMALLSIKNVGTLIVAVYGGLKILDGLYDLYKKHSVKNEIKDEVENCKNELKIELENCKKKLDNHAELLDRDKKHFDRVDNDIDMIKNGLIESNNQFQVLFKTMLALISFQLDSNNKDELKKAQKDLIDFLTDH